MDLKQFLPDFIVQRKYLKAGSNFWDALDLGLDAFGDGKEFHKILRKYLIWEEEYANRGFRTISSNLLRAYTRGKPIDKMIGLKRRDQEEPFLHSVNYIDYLVSHPADVYAVK